MTHKLLSMAIAGSILLSSTVFAANADAAKKYTERTMDNGYIRIQNEGGAQLSYDPNSGVQILEDDGYAFKDLNKNGKLDVYEDWRVDIDERVADLVSQMSLEMKLGNLANDFTGGAFSPIYPTNDEWLYSQEDHIQIEGDKVVYRPLWYEINKNHVTHYSYSATGTPKEQQDTLNAIQGIGEAAELGIPISFETDRPYNTFGSMINMPYYAFGIAHDPELLYNMVAQYSKEMAAMGYTTIFHSYGVEIGSWYGDEVNYISDMIVAETKAYEENGLHAMTKHYIARGGRNSFAAARSDAQLWENYMVPWKAAVQEGKTSTIMLNAGQGINNTPIYFDAVTLGYLRNELGFKGVLCTDWPLNFGNYYGQYTSDGRLIDDMTEGERYAWMMQCGIDQFGVFRVEHGTDTSTFYNSNSFDCIFWPDCLKEEIDNGHLDIAIVDAAISRAMKNKFRLGLFEDPYNEYAELEALFASDAYKAEAFELKSTDDVIRARTVQMNEWDEELMEKSSILLKNEILPLSADAKIYVTSNSEDIAARDVAAISAKATVVDTMEEADVIVAHMTALGDSWDYVIEDAQAAGKPIVLVLQGGFNRGGKAPIEPTERDALACAAIIMETYDSLPDHGTALPDFYRYTYPSITADFLFGARVPQGSTVYEIGRTADDYFLSWGDLQLDIGMDDYTRLYYAAAIRNQPDLLVPNNLGDSLYSSNFGMTYGTVADFDINTLVLPKEVVNQTDARGNEVSVAQTKIQKAGEAFPVMFIVQNNGADATAVIDIYDGDTVIASKFIALDEGQFRVVSIDVTLEAGEHTISVGGTSKTVTVE